MQFLGVGSGIDTQEVVQELLRGHRRPVEQLQATNSERTAQRQAYTQLSEQLGDLAGTAGAARNLGETATRQVAVDGPVTADTQPSTPVGSYQMDVLQLAARHAAVTTTSVSDPAATFAPSQLTVQQDGSTIVDVTADSLDDAAQQINDANAGVSARVVAPAVGEFQLRLTADQTGVDATFDTAGTGQFSSWETTVEGQDALLRSDGITFARSTNEFDDVIPDATVTVTAAGAATVDVTEDEQLVTDQAAQLAEELGNVLADLQEVSQPGSDGRPGGVLARDPAVRQIAVELRNVIASGTQVDGAPASFQQLGIALTRDGTVTFSAADADRFAAADPSAAQEMLANLAADIRERARDMSRAGGSISRATDRIDLQTRLTDQRIEQARARLDRREELLTRQFTQMEAAVAQLNSLQDQLEMQINGFNSGS